MANYGLKFFHVSSWPSTGQILGGIYFNVTAKMIRVWNGTAWEDYGGNITDATFENNVLTITKANNSTIVLDFSDVASAEGTNRVLAGLRTDVNNLQTATGIADGATAPTWATGASTELKATSTLQAGIEAIDTATTANASAITTEASNRSAADTTLQGNIDAIYKNDSGTESGVLINKINALDYTDTAVAGKYVSEVDESNGIISVTRADIPVMGVKSSENIASLDSDRKIQTTLTLGYVSDTSSSDYGKLQIKGINGTVIDSIDLASHFAKDSVLWGQKVFTASATSQEVSITRGSETQKYTFTGLTVGHQYLAMCFKNVIGKTTTYEWEKIDVSSLVDVYTGGTAIDITSNVVSVKVHTAGTSEKNFLEVNGSNELVVDHVDADCSKTTEKVEVAGGPLDPAGIAANNWPWYDDGKKVVPANLSMQEFIEGIFLKVIKGTVSKGTASWNPSLAQPSVSLTEKSVEKIGNDYEIGSKFTAKCSASSNVSSNSRSITVSQGNGSYGLFVGDTWQSDNKMFTVSGSVVSGHETASISSATWDGTDITASASSTSGAEVQLTKTSAQRFYALANGVQVQVGKFENCPICYGSTNTKAKNTDSSVDVNESSAPSNKDLSRDNYIDKTGKRAYWFGFLSSPVDTTKLNSSGIRAYSGLTKSFSDITNNSVKTPTSTFKGLVIVTDRTKSNIALKNAGGDDLIPGCEMLSNVAIEGANGFTAKNYNIIYCSWDAANAVEPWTITFK